MKSATERFDAPHLARTRTWTDDMDPEELDFEDEPTGELVTLGEIAVPAARVADTTPIAVLRARLVESRIPALVVIDATDTLVGVVARTDLLRTDRTDAVARDVMSPFVFALPHGAAIERAAALMAYEGVSFIIVTGDDHTLRGVVSALEIARHCAASAGYLIE